MIEKFSSRSAGVARILYFSLILLTVPVATLTKFSSLPYQATCSETSGVLFDLWLGASTTTALGWIFRIASAFALVGVRTRWACWAAVLSLTALSLNALKLCYFNHQILPLHLGLLFWALYGATSGFQLEARFLAVKQCDRDATWMILSMRVYFCIIFFLSGIAKIRGGGTEWMFGATLRNMLIVQNYVHEGFWPTDLFVSLNGLIVETPLVPVIAATLLVVSEVCAPFVFFKSRARPWLVLQLGFFQLMIYFTMYIDFSPWAALYVFFLPFELIVSRMQRFARACIAHAEDRKMRDTFRG